MKFWSACPEYREASNHCMTCPALVEALADQIVGEFIEPRSSSCKVIFDRLKDRRNKRVLVLFVSKKRKIHDFQAVK